MTDIQKQFITLLRNAVKKDSHIKRLIDTKKYSFKSGPNLTTEIQNFGNKLVGLYERKDISLDKIPKTTIELLTFISNIPGGNSSPTDCQEPLPKSGLTFDNIAGQDTVKEDIMKNYIYPFRFPSLFTQKTKGVLLYGPPGTGKTLLARASTAEIGRAAFFAPTPGDIKGMYEGETEKNIQKIFQCAQDKVDNDSKIDMSIIFIDEFDSVAGNRSDDKSMRRSVNAFLQAMDGIKQMKDVSVIAATNYPWDIDDAVLRRFTTRIFIDLPDANARKWLIKKVLAENYSNPGLTQKEIIKDICVGNNKSCDYFLKNIFNWGVRMCGTAPVKLTTKSWFSTKTISKKGVPISETFINKIVEMTGPIGKEATDIITNIKGGEAVESVGKDDVKFGYSASDITKMMNIAVQDTSFRSLRGGFFKTTFPSSGDYYISVPIDDPKAQYAIDTNLADEYELKQIPEKDHNRILNFSICEADIYRALEKYQSTIKSSSYIELLNYKYLNKMP